MSGMYLRCEGCGGFALPSPTEPGVHECSCGKTRTREKIAVDLDALRARAMDALLRARLAVHAVRVPGTQDGYTLSMDLEATPTLVLARDVAERYAEAINGEAALARAVLRVIAEVHQLRSEPRLTASQVAHSSEEAR